MTKQEKVIKDVIARYGETINLKKTPYVLIEILRQYGGVVGGGRAADCAPPGGPPDILDEAILVEEIARISSELLQISTALKKAPRKRQTKK